jgi:hypothetical protein
MTIKITTAGGRMRFCRSKWGGPHEMTPENIGGDGGCVACSKIRQAAYLAANPEKKRARDRAWHAANREKHRAQCRAWHAANREKKRASSHAWHAAHRDVANMKRRAWDQKNPEHKRLYMTRYFEQHPELATNRNCFMNVFAPLVFQRDHHTCQWCGQSGGKLNAHHIKPWKTFPELRFDLSNCTTVCAGTGNTNCHKRAHLYNNKHIDADFAATLKELQYEAEAFRDNDQYIFLKTFAGNGGIMYA